MSKAYAGNAFIDDATFRGKQTPGIQNVKYVILSISLSIQGAVERNSFKYKMTKTKRGSFLDSVEKFKVTPKP